MKTRMPSIIKSILFSSFLILIPYALVPHAESPIGWLGNAAEAYACPIKVPIVVNPESRTIDAGDSTSFTVRVDVERGHDDFFGPITVSVTGLPSSGVSTNFPVDLYYTKDDRSEERTLTIDTTCAVTPGTYNLTIKATAVYRGVTYEKYAYRTLIINSASPCFSVDAHEKKTVKAGQDTFFTTVVKWCKGYTGDVALSIDENSLPAGVTYSFDSNPVSPAGHECQGNAETKLRIHSTCEVPPGEYIITVTGTVGDVTDSDTVTLTVTEGGNFSISAGSQTPSEINPGGAADFAITGTFDGCFTGPVSLSVDESTLPAGVTVDTLSPGTISAHSPASSLRLKTSADTPAGTHEITITGVSEALRTRTTAVNLTITKTSTFTLSAEPTSRSIEPGETATYTITVNDGTSLPPYTVSFPEPSVTDGLTASIDPMSLPSTSDTNSVTLTVRTDATVQEGIYTITVDASGGGNTDSVTVTLAINEAPVLESAGLSVDKSVSPSSAKVGGMLLYTVEIGNTGRGALKDVIIRDHMPAGVGYVKGSTIIDGKRSPDPSGTTTLIWEIDEIDGGGSVTLKYHGVVKPNISRGKSTNTVTVFGTDPTGRTLTARASADLGVSSETLDRKGKIKGRVFVDTNGNGLKNVDEEGVSGIWVILETGERTTTDEEGMFQFDEVDSGQHLVAVDVRKLSKQFYVVGDWSKIVSLFSGGTGRTYFGLGRTGPTKEELEALKKAEEDKLKKEEEARKEEKKKEKEQEERNAPKGALFGNVFVDNNNNSTFNPGEKCLEKVTVLLDSEKRAVTDKMGNYRFEKVKAGRHTLSVYEDQEFRKGYRPAKKEKIIVNVKAETNNRKDIPVLDKTKLKINVELTVR